MILTPAIINIILDIAEKVYVQTDALRRTRENADFVRARRQLRKQLEELSDEKTTTDSQP